MNRNNIQDDRSSLLERSDTYYGHKQTSSNKKCIIGACIGAIVATILVIAAIAAIVMLVSITPQLIHQTVHSTNITLSSISLYGPTNTTINMTHDLLIGNVGSFSATLEEFEVTLSTKQGIKFGTMSLPKLHVPAYKPALVKNVSTTVTVTNFTVFQEQSRYIFAGNEAVWNLQGTVKVQPSFLSFSYSMKLNKDVLIPGKEFQDSVSYDLKIMNGTKTHLVAHTLVSLFNPSEIRIQDLGQVVFDVHYKEKKIGEAMIEEFSVDWKNNTLGSYLAIGKTSDNEEILNEFFSIWTAGNESVITLQGPTKAISPFLLNIVTQEVTVMGSPEPELLIEAVMWSIFYPEAINQTLRNTIDYPIKIGNITVATEAEDRFIKVDGCEASKILPGLVHPKNFSIGALGETTISLAIVADATPCSISRAYSIACLLYHQQNITDENPKKTFPAFVRSNFNIYLGDFGMNVDYTQHSVPLAFKFPIQLLQAVCQRPEPLTFKIVHYPICFTWTADEYCAEQEYWMHTNATAIAY